MGGALTTAPIAGGGMTLRPTLRWGSEVDMDALLITGGSATELSVTDAWGQEPLPVILERRPLPALLQSAKGGK